MSLARDTWDRIAQNRKYPYIALEPESDWRIGVGLCAGFVSFVSFCVVVASIFVRWPGPVPLVAFALSVASSLIAARCFRERQKR